jgi:hypothetical protein
MRHSLFWDVTTSRLVVIYRCFGTTYRSHLQGSSSPRGLSLQRVTFQNSKDLSLDTNCIGGLVGSVAGANECDKLGPTKIRSPNRAACTESLYRLSYPGIWIYGRRMKYELHIHVTVHRKRFLFNNQPDALIIQILFCYKTLHVSGNLFARQ